MFMGSPYLKSFDLISFFSVLMLVAMGLLMIWSTSFGGPVEAKEYEYFYRQFIFSIIGFILYFVFSRLDYRFLSNLSLWLFIGICVFLGLTYLWGLETRGSTRWIDLGAFRFQPSEFVKPMLILTLAAYIAAFPVKKIINLGASLLLAGLPTLLIFKQPDLGSALILVVIWFFVIIAGGVRFSVLLIMVGIGSIIAPLVWFFLKEYQRQRLLMFLDPSVDPLGSGYNVIQAIIAVGSGQILGRGFGRGTQSHLNFLPEYHTDFIFATLAEELGFIGSFLLIGLFTVLIWRTLRIAERSTDSFGSLIAVGVAAMLVFQVLVNMGMNMGVLPVTGIPLPLVSYGGSSLIATMISLGLVQSVAIHQKSKSEEIHIHSMRQ
jgi:rod shape determining protein RodA